MDDKIKYLLMAVGAYFLYDWYTGQADTPVVPVVPTGSGTGTGSGAPATPTTPATPAWTPPVYTPMTVPPAQAALMAVMDDDTVARNAVQGIPVYLAEAERRGMKYNFHQWNYFRSQISGEQPDPSTYYGGDPGDVVSAPQYLLVRATAMATGAVQGMSGMGWAPTLPWSTAWSA
jgi:hypothetical protein